MSDRGNSSAYRQRAMCAEASSTVLFSNDWDVYYERGRRPKPSIIKHVATRSEGGALDLLKPHSGIVWELGRFTGLLSGGSVRRLGNPSSPPLFHGGRPGASSLVCTRLETRMFLIIMLNTNKAPHLLLLLLLLLGDRSRSCLHPTHGSVGNPQTQGSPPRPERIGWGSTPSFFLAGSAAHPLELSGACRSRLHQGQAW